MKIKVNDQVKIIAGKDKGKTGTVIKTLRNKDKVVVEGINIAKKHQKPNKLSNVAATMVNLLGYEAPDMWDESILSF